MEGGISKPEVRNNDFESEPDVDGIRAERLIRLKRSRSGTLSSITSKRRDIDKLLNDPCNIELVKSEIEKFSSLYGNFCDAHNLFHKELFDELEINESEQYFQEVNESVSLFQQKVGDWLAITSSKLKPTEISPDDSASQASKSRASRVSSRVSSRASSLSSVRAKQAMKRAELKAELDAQGLKYSLEQEELRLKMEKERLNLVIELEKANAREQALQELEEEEEKSKVEMKPVVPPPVVPPPVMPSLPVKSLNPEAPAWSHPWGLPPPAGHPSPVLSKPVLKEKVSPSAASVKPEFVSSASPLSNLAIMMKQNEIMQEIISQQQKATLPKRNIPTFSGNPLEYCTFMRAFEAGIESKETDNTSRLYYLEQYTSGRAKELVRSCQHMQPDEGYKKAKELLKERFGQEHKLAMAYLDRVLSVDPLKSEDVEALDNFAVLLATCKNSLKAIGYLSKIENPDAMRKIVEKLPYKLQERWRDIADDIINVKKREVTVEDISMFVDKKVRVLSNPVFGKIGFQNKERQVQSQKPKSKPTSAFVAKTEDVSDSSSKKSQEKSGEVSKVSCPVCPGEHKIFNCSKFKEKSVKDRFAEVRNLKLCFGCLKKGHSSKSCFKKKPCSECDGKHSTLLHFKNNSPPEDDASKKKEQEAKVQAVCSLANTEDEACRVTGAGRCVSVLPVVPVKVRCKDTQECLETYALLDSGSNSTFCTESLVQRLGVKSTDVKIKLTTLDKHEEVNCSLVQELEVSDLDENVFIKLPEVFTRPEIPVASEEIPKQEDIEQWDYLNSQVQLPKLVSKVDLLIGVNVPEALEPKQVISSQDGGPYATKGLLGWTINGPIGRKFKGQASFFVKKTQVHPMCSSCIDFIDAYEDNNVGLSRDDVKFMELVENSLIQNEDHHYETALPIKDPEKSFPNNRIQAERRLAYLKRRFQKDPKFQEDYVSFIEDMIQKGYAEKVPAGSASKDDGKVWYLPHHGVYHAKKPGKIRVVFDCSAKYQGMSLNDRLLQGPDLTNNLVGVLTRFRQEPVAVMADIESMFYQVRVKEDDRDLLRFHWWPQGNLDEDFVEYRMSVHIFGATSSPSCTNFAMRKHAECSVDEFGEDVVDTVLKNFYVDDCLKSLPSSDNAITHARDLSKLMESGGFKLNKWISNDRKVLESIPECKRAKEVKNLDLNKDALPVERALGLGWCAENDVFKFEIVVKDHQTTRRGILSITSSMYDPLGLVSPVIVPAKILLQDLCRLDLGWDDEIPAELKVKWSNWLDDLPELAKFSINRCVKPSNFGNIVNSQIHHFSDASQLAYGSASYLRLVNEDDQVHCVLLMSKSRLVPLKRITIPRLELAAAAVSVKVHKFLMSELEIPIDKVRFWTDSMTVLRYLEHDTKRFHTYVANRVAYIRNDTVPEQWGYVGTKSNPADDVSRGMTGEAFLNCKRWVNGPEFLWKDKCDWPVRPDVGSMSKDDPEVKQNVVILKAGVERKSSSELIAVFQRFSSWLRLKKFVALCLRMQRWFRKKKSCCEESTPPKKVDLITVGELETAEEEICRVFQHEAFEEEIQVLSKKGTVKKSSPLVRLDPILIDGVLCVGGRLNRAPIPNSQKHQVIVPKNSHLSKLLVWHFHLVSGHSGREHVLSLLREKFWVVQANSTVRRMLHNCFGCKRRQSPALQQKMADLPFDRVSPGNPPFTSVGIDCFGPFYVRQKRSTVKRYGVIFTCLVVRAVHIEIAHSLESDSFIQSLRRFIARRGQVKEMRSDNGTNFVGGEKELCDAIGEWNQQKIHEFLLQKNIDWHFNPPTGSHHGGVWERCIRTIRKVLNALLKEQTLNDESLLTLMAEVEGVINSRPLTTVSADAKDLEPLTPNHLLQLKQGCSLPPGVFGEHDLYSRKRWRQVQYLADIFWKRWTREYLPLLQQRQKWNSTKRNVAVNDIVLLVDDTSPRNMWQIGRVSAVYPDNNGFVRRVRVVTRTSTLERPITKLCLLEEADSDLQPWSDDTSD